MHNSIDIVICVSLKDCYFLRKNLPFIIKNLAPSNIYVITDSRNFKYFNKEDGITLIDENNLIEGLNISLIREDIDKHFLGTKVYGWYFQQFLKMGFSLSQYAKEYYLIWDSDTVPLNPINFIDNEKNFFLAKTEFHKPYFDTILKLLGIEKMVTHSFISEHMIIKTEIMKSLISAIEDSVFYKYTSDEKWFEKCIYASNPNVIQGFSEFETYGNYCLKEYPSIFINRPLRTFRKGAKIFGIFASVQEIESLKEELDIVSFELYDYPISLYRKYKQALFFKLCKLILKCRTIFHKFPF